MTFLTPLFLIAAAAGALPVLLHMIHRRRAKELPFPTLRFLKVSVEKTRRRRRIQDAALMALRAAALVLVAIGLARPTVTGLGSLWGAGSRSAAVVVLDNSASMAAIDRQRPRLEVARTAATQILDQLGNGDQAALVLSSGPLPAEPCRLDHNQEQVRQRLAACRASYEVADLAARIDQARGLLAASDAANKHIFVLTDMQARSWQPSEMGAPPRRAGSSSGDRTADIPVILVDCHATPKPNVGVSDVRLAAALPIAGLPVRASVELSNASSIAQQRHVELVIDGKTQATSPAIELPPGGRVRHDFLFAFDKGGLHRGEARLAGRDGLALDDRRYFAKIVDRELAVAIVRGRRHEISYLDDAFYLQQALAPTDSAGSAIRTTMLDAAALAGEPLSAYRVIFCVNLPAPDDETASRLDRYVAEGGNLVWICGDRVEPDAYNRMNTATGETLLPSKLLEVRSAAEGSERDTWNVTFLDKTHPALAELSEPASLFQSILVYRHVRLDAIGPAAPRVLARLDDGEPLLAERTVGRGHVLFLGTSCQVEWTNLPLRPIFLPLVLRLTYELAGTAADDRQLLAGSPLVLSTDQAAWIASGVEIERPSGERIRPEKRGHSTLSYGDAEMPKRPKGKSRMSPFFCLRYADTHDPGIYVVRPLPAASSEAIAVAVNMDADESDARTISGEELRQRLGGAPLIIADNPEELAEVFRKLREGHSLRESFLSAVLFLLVFETFLANRFVAKGKPHDANSSPEYSPRSHGEHGASWQTHAPTTPHDT